MDIFSKLLGTVKLSKKSKFAFDAEIQNIEPTWHLQHKRKSHTTEEERKELADGTNFTIIGDPVGAAYNSTASFLCQCNSCGWRKVIGKNYLRDKTVNCAMCLNIRLEKEANERGLIFNGFSTDGDLKRRNYTFMGCGHSRNIASGDVRSGSFSCVECYSNELANAFDELGIENLGRPTIEDNLVNDTTQYYKIRFKACGHETVALQIKIIKRCVGYCKVCFEKELRETYEPLHDIKIIDTVPGAKRRIVFNKCGHDKIIGLSNLKSGSFSCTVCQTEKFKNEAELVGLKYLGVSDERRKGGDPLHKYEAPCGHTVMSVTSHIRTGHWTCRICDAGYLEHPNKLYLFKIHSAGFTFLKLGYSKTPEYRKHDYKMIEGTVTELLRVVNVPTGRDAIKYENEIHQKYSEFNYDKELIKKYLTESGFTECYPVWLQDKLIDELNLLETRLKVENNE